MHDTLVLASTARRLRGGGLAWRPQVGDWCTLIDAAHISGDQVGLWLVVDADATVGWINIIDAAAQWPTARISLGDALWLPSAGQLKVWLRALGYQVTTIEGGTSFATPSGSLHAHQGWAASILHGTPHQSTPSQPLTSIAHQCHAVMPGKLPAIEGAGMTEAEAVAEVSALVLASDPRVATRQGW